MGEIMMSVGFANLGKAAAFGIIFIRGFLILFGMDSGKLAYLFKVCAYGGLAMLMGKYIKVNELAKLGALDAFTFIFCCIECADNICNLAHGIYDSLHSIFTTIKNNFKR